MAFCGIIYGLAWQTNKISMIQMKNLLFIFDSWMRWHMTVWFPNWFHFALLVKFKDSKIAITRCWDQGASMPNTKLVGYFSFALSLSLFFNFRLGSIKVGFRHFKTVGSSFQNGTIENRTFFLCSATTRTRSLKLLFSQFFME